MLFCSLQAALVALCATSVIAAPAKTDRHSFVERNGQNFTVFEHAATGARMEFVTNSGICETTKGVNQYSGYLSVGSNMNMFFWFFEARNNPTTAPLSLWLNGGPGCSSMIGLFQENGPCHFVNGASTPSLNPYSFNTVSNMLYVDQPIGTGFSYGTDSATGTVSAAPYVWNLLQAFYSQFPQYKNRNFNLFTESYGGHYGPEFAYYFEQQNSANAGIKISLVSLGVNNGWFDPIIQYKSYADYAYTNSYKQLISKSDYNGYISDYNNDCVPALQQCSGTTGNNNACVNAQETCYDEIESPIFQSGDFDVYDIREPSNDPYPPETYVSYLQSSSVQNAIGAQVKYQECPSAPYNKFANTGDDSRSFLSTLGQVVASGVRTVIWAGDADVICNYMGGFNVSNAIPWSGKSTFASKSLSSYTVAGVKSGLFKTVSNLSWLQVFGAGHEVPYYQPATALQVFNQTINNKPLAST